MLDLLVVVVVVIVVVVVVVVVAAAAVVVAGGLVFSCVSVGAGFWGVGGCGGGGGMITFMLLPLASMHKTPVFTALLFLRAFFFGASLHDRSRGLAGWGVGGEDNYVHVTACGDHAQSTGIYSIFARCTTYYTRMWSKFLPLCAAYCARSAFFLRKTKHTKPTKTTSWFPTPAAASCAFLLALTILSALHEPKRTMFCTFNLEWQPKTQ